MKTLISRLRAVHRVEIAPAWLVAAVQGQPAEIPDDVDEAVRALGAEAARTVEAREALLAVRPALPPAEALL